MFSQRPFEPFKKHGWLLLHVAVLLYILRTFNLQSRAPEQASHFPAMAPLLSPFPLTFAFVAIAAAFGISVFLLSFPDQYESLVLSISSQNGPSSNSHLGVFSNLYRLGSEHNWPKLALDWRTVGGTVGAIFGAAVGSVGGVGGGGIFVPLLLLVIGFDAKTAPPLSKCMIMGQSVSTVWFNLRLKHPNRDMPIIDYDMALILQPMLLLGISMGVTFNVIFPGWLTTLLLIIINVSTSTRAFYKGAKMWNEEKFEIESREDDLKQPLCVNGGPNDPEEGNADEQSCAPSDVADSICGNMRWKPFLILWLIWISYLVLEILKSSSLKCSVQYWFYSLLQVPISIGVATHAAIVLYKKGRKEACASKEVTYNCSEYKISRLILYAFSGVIAGIIGGLLGLGGGAILGPLLLEVGQPPTVAGATAIFIMLFSSSMSVVEYYLLGRFPVPYALYLTGICTIAALWGQILLRKAIKAMGRTSIIIFVLAFVILFSSFTLGGVGIANGIGQYRRGEYMGFDDVCTS